MLPSLVPRFFHRQADVAFRQWKKGRLMKHLFLFTLHCVITLLSFPGLARFFVIISALLHRSGFANAFAQAGAIGVFSPIPSSFILGAYALFVTLVIVSAWVLLPFTKGWFEKERPLYALFLACFFPLATFLSIFVHPFALAHGCIFAAGLIGFIVLCMPSAQRMTPAMSLTLDCALGLSALLICSFSAEDYFSLQVDRYAPVVFLCTLLLGCVIFFLLAALPRVRFPRTLSFVLVAALLFCLTFLIQASYEPHHYSFFLGPVLEQLYGGRRPFVDLYAQYGLGMTTALTLYFRALGFVSAEGLLFLLKCLTFGTFVLLYILGCSLYRSRLLAFLTVLAIFAFHFSFSAPQYYQTPSTTALRFGLIWLVLIVLTLRHEMPSIPRWITDSLLALLAAVATLWSLDSFVYVVLPVIGWFVLSGQWRAFGVFLLRYAGFLVVLGLLLLAPSLLSHQSIHLSQYYTFQLLYSEGYNMNSVYDRALLWILFPALYLLFTLKQLRNPDQDPRLTILALHGLAILTYFVWRAHWRILFPVSIPFILLSVAFFDQIVWPRRVALTLVLTLFLSSLYFYTVNVGMHRWVPLTTARDIDFVNPFSPNFALSESAFRRKHCPPALEKLRTVMVGQSLPLIFDRADGYNIYACLRSYSAFNVDPIAQLVFPEMGSGFLLQLRHTTISSFAISQMTGAKIVFHGETPDFTGDVSRNNGWDFIRDKIITPLHLQSFETFSLYGETMHLYRRSGKMSP